MEQRGKLFSRFLRHPGFLVTLCLTLLTTFAFQFGVFAATAPDNIISYQGRLLDANGVPVTAANATMIFRLYSAPSGGSCVWSNSSGMCASATGRTVTLTDGLFSENLGDTGDSYAAIADTVFADDASVYLDVSVNGESLTPRKRLTAAPYALNSQSLDGLSSSSYLNLSGNTLGATDAFSINAYSTEHSATSAFNVTLKPTQAAGLSSATITEVISPAAGLASGQYLIGNIVNLAPDADDDRTGSGLIGSLTKLTALADKGLVVGSMVDFSSQTGGYSAGSAREVDGYDAVISMEPSLADAGLNTMVGFTLTANSVGSNALNELVGFQLQINQLDTMPTNLHGAYLGKNDGAIGGSGVTIEGNWLNGIDIGGIGNPSVGINFGSGVATDLGSVGDIKIEAGADTVINLPALGDFLVKDNDSTFATFAHTGAITFVPTSGQNFTTTLAGGGVVDINLGTYTYGTGGVDIARGTNFTGTAAETAVDLQVKPSLTLTEPGSGEFTWNLANIDFSGVAVTAGGGDSVLTSLRVAGASDADASTVNGVVIDTHTATAAVETALTIGTGWDTGITVAGGNNTFTLGATQQFLINATATDHTDNAPLTVNIDSNASGWTSGLPAAIQASATSTGMTGGTEYMAGVASFIVPHASDVGGTGIVGNVTILNSTAATAGQVVGFETAATDMPGLSTRYGGSSSLTGFRASLDADPASNGTGSIYGIQAYVKNTGTHYSGSVFGAYFNVEDLLDASTNAKGVVVNNGDAAISGDSGVEIQGDWTYGVVIGNNTSSIGNGLYFEGVTTDITANPGEDLVIQPGSGGAGNLVLNLPSTGDLEVRDNGTAFLTLSDTGGFALTLDGVDNPSMTVDNNGSSNIQFNLAGTGDFTIQDNGSAFLTINDAGSLNYVLDAADDSTFSVTSLGQGGVSIGGNMSTEARGSSSLFNVNIANDGSNDFTGTTTGSMAVFWQGDTASSGTAAYVLQEGSGYAFQVDDVSADTSPFLIEADGDVFLGGTAETNSNSGFTMDGNDMFIAGSLGVESSVYTDGSFVAGASTTISNGSISQSSGEALAVGTTSADLTLQSTTSGDIVLSPAGTSGVGIGTAAPIAPLHVPVRVPTSTTAAIASGASTDIHGLFAQGRYVYFVVEDGASDELRVYDYSVPTSPVQMGTGRAVTSSNDYNLYVQGQYAYVYGASTLSIFDVSNPADTSGPVGTIAVNGSSIAYNSDLYVAGRYAYVLAGGSDTVQIIDVSNPTSPALAGTINTYNAVSTQPNSIEVKGDYAFIATNGSSTSDDFILAYDVSNPAEATLVDASPTVTGECDTAMDFTMQGRYGYVACYSTGNFETYDLSDPTAIAQTDVLATGLSFPWGVFVQGQYAFVGHNAFSTVQIIDISDPTAASITGSFSASGSVINDLFVNGRYLFVGSDSTTEGVDLFDLGGSYIQQFEAGGIEASALNLRNSLYAMDGAFMGGLSVSQSLQVSGGISAGSSALTQITANIATLNTLDIEAAALAQTTAAGTINWRGANIVMPNITQTTGTITADGLRLVNGSITTGGTENMINLAAAGVGAGTLRALNIGSITPSSGTETAITVGAGWDTGISLTTGAATTAWNLDATTNDSTLTSGVVDLNIDSATNSNIGFNIDYTSQSGISAASDVFAEVINLTQNDTDGDLFGLFVNAAAVSTTLSGTNYYECLLCAENDENSSASVLAAVWINSTAGTAGSITNGILINTTDVTTDFNMQNAETISNDSNGTVTISGSSNAALVDFIDAASGSVVADFDGSVRLDLNIAGSSTEAVCSTVGGEGDTNTVLDDCTTTVSADYMEMYPTASDVGVGDILVPGTEIVTTQGGATLRQLVKSVGAYQSSILGIASNPADAGDFNSIGYNLNEADRPWPVALNGRVPVKVNSENGSIVPGDMITTSSVPGVGMKATEPGMVVGMAIDSWTGPGTGTVMVFVQTGWHAGSAIGSDGSLPLFTDSFAFSSLGNATAVDTGKDSYTLSFRGSGWNGTSAEDVGMGIKLAATDATAYRLSFTNKTDTEVAYVTGTGDLVLSGKLYPSDRGVAQTDKYIYYDGSAGPGGDFMRTNASGWSTGSYDFAEMFPSAQGLAPGELVVASPSSNETVERSGMAYQKTLLGIVSTKPGFLAGDNKTGQFPIALKGRVPTLVNAENGPIAVGDPLTSSSTPGYAMKALKAGPIVGYALEPFSGQTGAVIAFVSLGWWEPDAVVAPVTSTTSGIANTASGAPVGGSMSSLNLDGGLFLAGADILGVRRIAGIADRWSIEEDGTVKTEGTYKAVITSLQNEKVDTYATLNREQKVTLSGTGRLVNGMATIAFEMVDAKFNDITSTTAPVRVQVTLRGPANGVYVSQADHNGFDVRELANGSSTVDFDWYAEAYRLGQEPPVMGTTPVEPPPVIEPVVTEPIGTGSPSDSEPPSSSTDGGSAPAESVVPEPVVSEPVPVAPVVTEPAPTEPVVTEPVVWEPAPAEPVPAEPVPVE